jgi:type IV secretion system protein VirB6
MSACADLIANAGSGVAPTLDAVDCMSASASAGTFGHVLGPHGVLTPALVAALTIYVALYGLALLTGRARLSVAGASGRMLALGLVLAFATSWAFYGPLVWLVATRTPDAVAGAVLGGQGSASATFARRIDTIYAAVTEAAHQAAEEEAARNAENAQAQQQPGGEAPARKTDTAANSATAGFAPATVATGGAIVLLLATVGVLVTARIVLAALLLVGPVFVVMALFPATRGLFAGWLRALVMAMAAPLLVVLGGAFTLELAVPTVARLLGPDGIDTAAASGFFLIATIHAALMAMALRAAQALVLPWAPWSQRTRDTVTATHRDHAMMVIAQPAAVARLSTRQALRVEGAAGAPGFSSHATTVLATRGASAMLPGAAPQAPNDPRRAAGIGSRFRPAARARDTQGVIR